MPTQPDLASDGFTSDGFTPVVLDSARGPVEAHHYIVPNARRAALWVGGVGGGFDTPARGLYPRLCHSLRDQGIQSLRVRFRRSTSLPDAVADVLEGIEYLRRHGVAAVALTGHSFGGAVVVQAALSAPDVVRTVVTLASQGFGADGIANLHCPVLLIHGEADDVLPPKCSLLLHRLAPEPKRLVLMPGAGHCLDETAEAVCREVEDWIVRQLGAP